MTHNTDIVEFILKCRMQDSYHNRKHVVISFSVLSELVAGAAGPLGGAS